ncbi:undecaprenyl/decaprenyl-phosphate alpha-N-acetylglucosaminyl 1-phosphate transferase [Halosquirtibacter xylanolyticus]|uniref:glycosyltransferase family 4 protein n=1 Tax=Halosquirtibacter xylanolyticus TaxID=3374599 RepID=UPI0037495DEB|nr:undecaprenyl/decaprenyl-phosphate alpha-N-acetylglucosaminyl 1-phosphate transferase [Prolixibacteraceae bacterium]
MSVVLINIIAIVTSLFVTMACVPTLVHVSKEKKLFDEPNGRSATKIIVPTLGGLAVYLGFITSLTMVHSWLILPNLSLIMGCLTIMLFLGLKDDILVLSPKKKLVIQLFVASLLVVAGDFRFTSLHGCFGIESIPYFISYIISVFACIVIINAFNLIDGIDGLASGLSILISTFFGIWFSINNNPEFSIYCFCLSSGLAGFFYYNFKGGKNKIFMGDTGSMLIGTLMYIFVVNFNELNLHPNTLNFPIDSAPAVSFGLLIYPLYDVLRVFTIRILQKKSPMSPDKNHIHHRMLALGLSHHYSTMIIIGFNFVFVVSVILLQSVGNDLLFAYILIAFGSISTIPSIIIARQELICKNDPYQKVFIPRFFRKTGISENKILPESNIRANNTQASNKSHEELI